MTDLETTAATVRALPGVLEVVAIEPGTIEVVADKSVEGVKLAVCKAIGPHGAKVATVYPATVIHPNDAERWREGHDFAERQGCDGTAQDDDAHKLAAAIGIAAPPVLNAWHAGKLGYLFATVGDAQAFDRNQ